MVFNLLQSEGIEGRIDGEYLQGGAGELQAMNMVRVMVNESDYTKAQSIIDDWESKQIEKTKAPEQTKKPFGMSSGLMIGLIIGAGSTFWAYNSPVVTDGIDHNNDGKLDEKWIYRDNRISSVEMDRNLDGKIDVVNRYNRKGRIYKGELDDNFDGVRETIIYYDKRGNPTKSELDTNGDKHIDYRILFEDGVFYEVHIIDPYSDHPRKIQSFRLNKLVSSKYDSNGDGNYDTVLEYDYYEEIK